MFLSKAASGYESCSDAFQLHQCVFSVYCACMMHLSLVLEGCVCVKACVCVSAVFFLVS